MSTASATGADPVPSEIVRHKTGHHWKDAEQEFSAAKLGIWLFLATELLMSGGLFVGYAVYRSMFPETFHEAHKVLSWQLGATNTLVLIFSSFTMATAIRAAMLNKQKQMMLLLFITLLCAGAFMVIKLAFEWPHKFHDGTLPGKYYFYEGLAHVPNPHVFFSLYFLMTGLHGIHVVLGMVVIAWLLWRGHKGHFYSGHYTPVELTGLYWHLVDLIWIFLFPLFYLIG
jgi:cytochrome c oxidase subunit III